MTNDSTVALAAIVFHAGGATYLSADGTSLPAPERAAEMVVAALWERPSAN